jgi:ABC-type oligopeptide transport system ATPase subunit
MKKPEEIIRLKNVCKSFQMGEATIRAVCGIDLTINKASKCG